MPSTVSLVWLRSDLRLADNPALSQAFEESESVIPVFVWAPEDEGAWPPGPSRRYWLHRALHDVDQSLRQRGSRLVLRAGDTAEELRALARETGASRLFYSHRYEPAARTVAQRVTAATSNTGVVSTRYDASILHDVEEVRTTNGGPYRVFTPFWQRLQEALEPPPPLPAPRISSSHAPLEWPPSLPLDELQLVEDHKLAGRLAEAWDITERAGHDLLETFLDEHVQAYPEARDVPADDGTSRLSPYLATGMLSPLQVWHAVRNRMSDGRSSDGAAAFLRQIGWREFGYHLLHHFPRTPAEPLNRRYASFPWRRDDEALQRWKAGETGYPFVDAGMRQLAATGWMHNRLRMIVASFLTKHLLIPWQEGARFFWHHLVDADLANNTLGWQWAAGSGADAQPFFRIFNPVTQGKKYDGDGRFVRRWIPELADLPNRFLHAPWTAPPDVLDRAGVHPGLDYPEPIVEHAGARRSALEAYESIR